MKTRRLSILLPLAVDEEVRNAAVRAGVSVSTYVADAVAEKAALDSRIEVGRRAIREIEDEFGPLPAASRIRARRALSEAGPVGPR